MARGKRLLDGSQRNQVVEMVKAGKTPEEIIGFVKQTYGVEINAQYVSNVKTSLGGGRKKQKRSWKRPGAGVKGETAPAKDEKDMSIEELARDVEALIKASHEIYRGIFLHLRRELIKSVGKIRDLREEFKVMEEIEGKDR